MHCHNLQLEGSKPTFKKKKSRCSIYMKKNLKKAL